MDELKCTRVMMNMISNARKFTPTGGTVTYGIQQISEPVNGVVTYRFFVRDTGIGMSDEFKEKASVKK